MLGLTIEWPWLHRPRSDAIKVVGFDEFDRALNMSSLSIRHLK